MNRSSAPRRGPAWGPPWAGLAAQEALGGFPIVSTAGQPDPRFADVGRLVVRCPDRPGIVAVLSGLMAEVGANIIDSQQHSSDPSGGTFTLRLEFFLADLADRRAELERRLTDLAAGWRMVWRLTEATDRPTVAVFVSRTDHVLQELVYRVRAGDLRADIVADVSNHPDLEPVARA